MRGELSPPRAENGQAMIVGSVVLDPARRAQVASVGKVVQQGAERRIAGPGLDISVRGDDADLALHRGMIVACQGRPRFDETRLNAMAAAQGPATAWAELLLERGTQGLQSAGGAYAVAYVDLGAGTAVAACDRFAIKPLCFAHAQGRFAFATRADAVALEGRSEVDPQALYEYLYYHMIPTPRTVFRGVSRLCPAHFVEATAAGTRSAPYWMPRFEERRTERLETLEAEFLELVGSAVAREVDGKRVACFLSGGTDSSTVTGMLAKHGGGAPSAYSIGFDAQGYDEMQYARVAAQHFGADHRIYYITPADLVESIPKVAVHYDQPFGNSSALPAYYCAKMAAAEGVQRLLAGDGGDELFGGNTRYAKQRVFEVYHMLPAGLRRSVLEPALLGNPIFDRLPLVRKGVSYVRQARLEMPERLETYNLLLRLGVKDVLTPAFLASVDASLPMKDQRAVYNATSTGLVNAMLAYDWKYTLADNDLPKVCGTADMAGVEVAFPLLADELVDFSLRLPASLKLRGLTLRYFFKRALRGFLPQEILRKSKHGFGLPFGPWLLADKRLFDTAAESLADLAARGIVARPFIDQLLATRVREVPGYYGGMVWVLMMLEQWLRQRAPSFKVEGS